MKITRKEQDKLIAGVCMGVAAAFGWEEWRVRLVFLILTLFGGAGALVYIVLWFLLPQE